MPFIYSRALIIDIQRKILLL